MTFAEKQQSKIFNSVMNVNMKKINERGEEIVDVKGKLSAYFSEITQFTMTKEEFITKNEAKREKKRIERLFTSETDQQRETRIKKEIITEIKRKYTIQYREAVRFILELFIL